MQENAAAGALLKWPVGVREGFSARREPRVRAGDFPGTTEHQLGDNAEAALCLVVISARNGWGMGKRAPRSGFVWAQGGRAGMTIGTKVVVWALARARNPRQP